MAKYWANDLAIWSHWVVTLLKIPRCIIFRRKNWWTWNIGKKWQSNKMQISLASEHHPVRPDWAKVRHFGRNSKVFGKLYFENTILYCANIQFDFRMIRVQIPLKFSIFLLLLKKMKINKKEPEVGPFKKYLVTQASF